MDKDTKLILMLIAGGLFAIFVGILVLLSLPFGNSVAVIPIQGTIAYGQSDIMGGGVTTPDNIKELIREAEDDYTIRSILLEINSPGGSPVACEEIMEAVKSCKKPVAVWISDVGASGAYLAASPADRIVASPTSLVGSIGVILDLVDLSELYRKIGVNRYVIKGGEYKDMGADYRNLTPEETKMLQDMVNEDYDYFISLVAENRKLSKEYVRGIAEGKIYTGRQAKNLKLVDEIGSKKDALDIAAKLGGITGSYDVVTITPPVSFEDFLSNISSNIAYSLGKGIGSVIQKGAIELYY